MTDSLAVHAVASASPGAGQDRADPAIRPGGVAVFAPPARRPVAITPGVAWLLSFVALTLMLIAGMPRPAGAADLRAIAIRGDERATRVTLTLSDAVAYAAFVLPDPDRVVIDLPDTRWRADPPSAAAPALIGTVRHGPFRPGVLRLVFDSRADLRITGKSLVADGPGHKLTIELAPRRAAPQPTAARDAKADDKVARADRAPNAKDGGAGKGREDGRKGAKTAEGVKAKDGKAGASPRGNGATGIAAKASSSPRVVAARAEPAARRRVVVIDPGHGGDDPGAIGDDGLYEKHVTLAAARAIRDELRRTGNYRVVLTRDRDVFIPLRQRIAIARAAGADLFISVHADKMDNRAVRGLSIYTLSERASDAEAAALADRENKADLIAGVDLSHESPDVASILIGLAQRYTMNSSAQLASVLVREMRADMMLLPKTHRFAGFAVLKAPDVPAVLIEMGYLSNPQDEDMLRDPAHRRKLARAIGRSVDSFFGDVERASLR